MNSSTLPNTKAILLCAGEGTRLGKLTKHCPKPLLPVNGKPLIVHTLNLLKKAGIDEVVINVCYLKKVFTELLGNGEAYGIKIHYLEEEQLSGTAGAVKKAQEYLENSSEFLTIYGDLFLETNLSLLIEFHRKNAAAASICLHKRKNSNSFVKINEQNEINSFVERPGKSFVIAGENWVNSGIYCFNPCIFSEIPQNEFMDFPKDVFPNMIGKGFFGLPFSGERVAVDSAERYQMANDLCYKLQPKSEEVL
ncbi:MAG: nucleotidyltransferase family protein [Halobacteriovoraceae bacterium]|jgi:NDP-sugar pyrophosphorylase family protein|nr:nucleotidyltransferase family protein [Halobacteriovoraceae bacterium]MBT5094584.1 nucleotidyltransferase family protein [Halobacteriovoraceae bacterium]